jgi:hypothetical protein
MIITFALLLTLVPATTVAPVSDARTRYVELAAKHDEAACQELWRKERASLLPIIDADLEGSLKVREDAGTRDLTADEMRQIQEMHARAVWGATQAATVGHPFVLDYATSFVGWNEEQRADFRAGQRAYGEARGALKKGDIEVARAAGRRCRELAAPLGDWWGAQSGWEVEARALEMLGDKAQALAAWSRVRLVALSISLVGDEYEATSRVAALAAELGRTERAKAAVDSAIALAVELGDSAGKTALEKLAREQLGVR